MRVAVTGAGGFLGGHVVAALERRSILPHLLLRSGEDCSESMRAFPRISFDLLAPPDDAFEILGRPDTLIHLAWGGLPNYGSLHHLESELPGHFAFLSGLLMSGLGNLFVSGSCFEYGRQSGALSEELVPQPENPYGVAKNTLRSQLESLQEGLPFKLTWGRIFYLFGEGQAAGSLFPALRKAAEGGQATFPMTGGEQLRDYLPVEEAAEIIVALALADRNTGVVNICSGSPASVRELAAGWIKAYGWRIRMDLGRLPYPAHEPMAFWGGRTKLNRCLGLEPPSQQHPGFHEFGREERE